MSCASCPLPQGQGSFRPSHGLRVAIIFRVSWIGTGILEILMIVSFVRSLHYVWAFPTTMLGLPFVPLALLTGGGVQVVQGVLEVYGGKVKWILRNGTLLKGGASAMTLGHVVLGLDRRVLGTTRSHERVHVQQCERWGPLFVPLYLLASLWALLRGRDPYLENTFELEARRQS